MDTELFELILWDIENRSRWATKLSGFYALRRDGIRRKNKPWPFAADMHAPIVDTVIDKMKPFYLNQLFMTDRYVDMVGKDPQKSEYYTDCAWWFDYKTKNYSNFEDQIPIVIDYMMVYAHGIMQTTWDTAKKCLRFKAVNPLFLVVPSECGQMEESDRVCYIKHLSKWEYMNGPFSGKYNQDAAFIKRICGSAETSAGETTMRNTKTSAEGITYSTDETTILLWEVYEKDSDGNFMIHTISPKLSDEPVRESRKMPYKNGYHGEPELPFIDFKFENNDEDYYDARGVAEILFPHQQSCKKMWDDKHDCITLFNKPMLTSDRDYPSITNIRTIPGQILPGNIRAIQMGAPPISYDAEMANCRLVAEQRIGIPDFGIGGQPFKQTGDRKTATEINSISGYSGQVSDMRGRGFRRSANKVFCQAWGLLKQYDYDLAFIRDDVLRMLPYDEREEIISIKPTGSSDSWNLHLRLQRAAQRKQMFTGSPYINQGELDKSCLELDEPGLVARLYQDPEDKQHEEAEKEMLEVPALDTGFPVTPDPSDDDAARIPVLFTYLIRNIQIGKKPTDPAGPIMLRQHIEAHIQQAIQKDPKIGNQFKKQWEQIQKVMTDSGMVPQGQNGQAPQPQEQQSEMAQ